MKPEPRAIVTVEEVVMQHAYQQMKAFGHKIASRFEEDSAVLSYLFVALMLACTFLI